MTTTKWQHMPKSSREFQHVMECQGMTTHDGAFHEFQCMLGAKACQYVLARECCGVLGKYKGALG